MASAPCLDGAIPGTGLGCYAIGYVASQHAAAPALFKQLPFALK